MSNKTKQTEALALNEQGFSPLEISKQVGVSVRTVYRYLNRNIAEANEVKPSSAEDTTINNKIDRQLLFLFRQGRSTKYKCLGVISEHYSLTLTDKQQLTEAKRLLANAIKRLQRRGIEFHIMPEFLVNSSNAQSLLKHFYTETESLWHHLEQVIESIAEANYTQENKTRIKFQIRSELAKALCLPAATHTARELANTRAETFWRIAEITDKNKTSPVDTNENLGYIQQDVEQHILDRLGIAQTDIPY